MAWQGTSKELSKLGIGMGRRQGEMFGLGRMGKACLGWGGWGRHVWVGEDGEDGEDGGGSKQMGKEQTGMAGIGTDRWHR